MKIDDIGYNHRHEKDFVVDRPNGVGDWLLLIIKSPAVYRCGGREFRLPGNVLLIYTPGTQQYYRADCAEYFDDWMHFWPDDSEISLIHSLGIKTNVPLQLSESSGLSAIMGNMCFEHYSSNANRDKVSDHYFRILLYKASEKLSRNSSVRTAENLYAEKLLYIRESIYRWPSRDYTVDDMAKELSLSRSRFQHIYSETFGTSVTKDIIASRLNKASELLRTTDTPVKDIALIIGYGHNASYFVKLFGSIYGMSPGQYRKTHSGKDKE
ncbi:MAG: helix-turn-helix transcriptional regulator [Ruminococcus sp.]|nr:helix-turn-helix transcriptional regulator [Ruminococcus sp.]